ncbi:hypothetical protein HNR25_002331 [Streptomonospora salina]|uniref:Transposase IS701-like DDE domain-containing protein n=1 Tax=Streptomonospora salina TaxID=104205 RepID=A0A841EDQ0_9ACTN|nr:hypothetical protein [Streptomonospora salina]
MLQLTDALAESGATAGVPVVAKVCTPTDARGLVTGLAERGADFLVAVPDRSPFFDHAPARLRPRTYSASAGRSAADVLAEPVRVRPRPAASGAAEGPRRLASAPVRVTGTREGSPVSGSFRLIADPDAQAARPPSAWLTNMAHPPADLLRLGGVHGQAVRTVDDLAGRFGLLDFEGRTFPGWHHHATLVSAAYCFDSLPDPRPQPV